MRLIPWKQTPTLTGHWLGGFDREFDELVENAFGLKAAEAPAWAPRLDIRETKDAYEIKADLPGLEKSDISIEVEDGTLSISGERKAEKASDEGGWHRVERSYGSFRRALSLPREVREDEVKADYKDGVLTVTLPKAEEAKARRIDVQ